MQEEFDGCFMEEIIDSNGELDYNNENNSDDEILEIESSVDFIEESPKTLVRDQNILREIEASSIQNNLDALHDDLNDKGYTDEEEIESILEQERINQEIEFERTAFGQKNDILESCIDEEFNADIYERVYMQENEYIDDVIQSIEPISNISEEIESFGNKENNSSRSEIIELSDNFMNSIDINDEELLRIKPLDYTNNEIEELVEIDGNSELLNEEITDSTGIADRLSNEVELNEETGEVQNQFEDIEELYEEENLSNTQVNEEAINEELENEFEVNINQIYEGLNEYEFDGINIEDNAEIGGILNGFVQSEWNEMTSDNRMDHIESLRQCVCDLLNLENPPKIEYYNNIDSRDFGNYDNISNTLNINEFTLNNSNEAADTVAHELWHAYQHQCAKNPRQGPAGAIDYQRSYGLDHYVYPNYTSSGYCINFEDYQDQLVESEARAFAEQFKEMLNRR